MEVHHINVRLRYLVQSVSLNKPCVADTVAPGIGGWRVKLAFAVYTVGKEYFFKNSFCTIPISYCTML